MNTTPYIFQSPHRTRTAVGLLVCSVVMTLAACTSSNSDATNVWPLTGPNASVGDVRLSADGGARWTGDGLELTGTGSAGTAAPGPIDTDSSFTVSAWARPSGQPADYSAVLSQSGQVAGAFFLGVAEGYWSFSVKPADGNGDDFVTNRDRARGVGVQPDVWVHLAGVYDSAGGRARFFLNGYPASVEGVATAPLFPAAGSLLFGRGQAHGDASDFFAGTVADVSTWSRALDAGEIADVARASKPDGASLERPPLSKESNCLNPHGGVCVGPLEAGTYSTEAFSPSLSYSVPEGWTNSEDLPGNVLLIRSGDSQEGTWGGSYIGVYQNIHAASQCGEEAVPGVGVSAAELVAWYRTVPGLDIVQEKPIAVGGLSGVALDLSVRDGWTSTCPLDGVIHAIPIIIGGGVSDLHHVLGAPLDMRLFLLDWGKGNVAIEVTVVRAQHSLTGYLGEVGAEGVIDSFTFSG